MCTEKKNYDNKNDDNSMKNILGKIFNSKSNPRYAIKLLHNELGLRSKYANNSLKKPFIRERYVFQGEKRRKLAENECKYSKIRMEREIFRKKLANLISGNDEDNKEDGFPSVTEKKILRYYYYTKHGVDTVHVAPLDTRIIQRIYSMIPKKFLAWKIIVEDHITEIKSDYMFSMKKAIIDFILSDSIRPIENERKTIFKLQKNLIAGNDNNPRFEQSQEEMKKNLFCINACVGKILYLWNSSDFRGLRFIDVKQLTERKTAYELTEFTTKCLKQIEKTKKILVERWYQEIENILSKCAKKNLMPSIKKKTSWRRFFNCISVLMTQQLEDICITSLESFSMFLQDYKKSNPGFNLNVLLQNEGVLAFQPTFKKMFIEFSKILDAIISSIQNFPRIESLLYKNQKSICPKLDLSPKIPPAVITACRTNILNLIEDQRIFPELKLQDFDPFINLMNGCDSEIVKFFVRSDMEFCDYCDKVEYYRNIEYSIANQIAGAIKTGLFDFHRETLIQSFEKLARYLQNQLLQKMVSDQQNDISQLEKEYEEISNRATSTPYNTAELFALRAFVANVEEKVSFEMETRLKNNMDRVLWLMSHTLYSPLEIKKNSSTCQRYLNLPQVFVRHRQVVAEKMIEYEELLKKKIELFRKDLQSYWKQVQDFENCGEIKYVGKYKKKATALENKLISAMETIDAINAEEIAYGWEISQYTIRKQTHDKLTPYKKLYDAAHDQIESIDLWLHCQVGSFDPDHIQNYVLNTYRTIQKLEKHMCDKAQAVQLINDTKVQIDAFKQNMPIISTLGNPGMKERHWEQVSEIIGFPIKISPELTLENVIDYQLEEYVSKFESISESATKENKLENTLNAMILDWEPVEFGISEYRDTGTYKLSTIDDIQILLDDQIIKTQTMKTSPYIKPFEKQVIDWEAKLYLLQDILDDWVKVQATWMYLEPIFSSPDIQQQMPEEGRRFSAVDKIWKDLMKQVSTDCKVMVVVEIDKMSEKLKKAFNLLEIIQKGLYAYLEKKRLYFPRFFFLSNDELLEILSETKDPKRVQPHLKKCFEGIATLSFDENLDIYKMLSSEGEEVVLADIIKTVKARGQVEKWLLELEISMKKSVRLTVREAYDNYYNEVRENWVLVWPGQAVQAISLTYWTAEITKSLISDLPKSNLIKYLSICETQITKIIDLVRGSLNAQNRLTLSALIVVDVHERDVLTELVEAEISDINDFFWISQLRYYFENSQQLDTCMINSTLKYGYEYLGNTTRLVITPLTDRCYRTLFGALHLHLGGAPEGPAGTGKTETIKDLAKAVAKQCIVFNCSDGLDYIAFGKFFKGIASCGAWSCFDEFDRIDLEVLSVIAQQILAIQRGIHCDNRTFYLEDTLLNLDQTCAVFITLNPGYAGRSELPDNLKILFRPVAMMVPDSALISEIELYSYGFLSAKKLAIKVVTTYRLCSEQLSSKRHYDYGMRAVKSVLKAAGNFKLRYKDELEDILILRSIKDVNLAKFLKHDLALFEGIISDLFPEIILPAPDYEIFNKCIEKACEEVNIQCTEFLLKKIQQIYEMILVRHGLMIVGLPFGGKTTSYRCLAKGLQIMEEQNKSENKAVFTIINPKAVTMGELYGEFDAVSREWKDGILPVSFRAYSLSITKDRKWLLFDGPVDTIWIENMNTVLDDNKKLCLLSGEIIQLSPTTNLIFEPMDLEAASPATVSRCGMIYMEPTSLGWNALVISWTNNLPNTFNNFNKQLLFSLFHRFCPILLFFIRKGKALEMAPTSDSNLIVSLINLFDTFLDDFHDEKIVQSMSDLDIRAQIEGIFFFSCIWALGGPLDIESRDQFNVIFRALLEKIFPENLYTQYRIPDYLKIQNLNKPFIFPIPKPGSIFDYRYIKEGKGKWKLWSDDINTNSTIPRDMPVNQIIVPTSETIRILYLLNALITHNKALLLVGPTGTGKSCYIIDYLLNKIDLEIYKPLFLNFSAQTSASQTQDIIMSKLDKRRKGVYGPPLRKKCVIFVDDVSMPQKENYGAQPAIELLRMILDHWMWYDRKTSVPLKLIDIQFVCAMAPVSSGNSITPRFQRHFNCVAIDEFNDVILRTMFSKIVLWHLDTRGFSKEFDPCIDEIVSATLNIYRSTKMTLLPTPSKSHYLFNLRDFSKVIQGVLLSVPEATEDLNSMRRLWVHEILRVYGDRLVDEFDRKWLFKIIKEQIISNMSIEPEALFERFLTGKTVLDEEDLHPLIFCDFTNPKADTRNYIEVQDLDELRNVVEAYLVEFNNMSKKPMNLVLFRFAIEHLSKISRIIKQPRSHSLLIGVGGSGRQSLTRLAAHICDYELFQIELSQHYDTNEWQGDIKTILLKISSSDTHGVFLFSDIQIKKESFLEDINNLLHSGEVPNLFTSDEKADVCEKMRQIDRQRDKAIQTDGSALALYNFFVQVCRDQLHIVLAMSPIGDDLRLKIRKFPSIVNCCTIDWFQAWPQDALLAISTRLLTEEDLTEKERKAAIDMCVYFHISTQELTEKFAIQLNRYTYVTPTSYLEIIQTFKALLSDKRKKILDEKNKYLTSISQLETASEQINVMQEQLTKLEPKLKVAAETVAEQVAKVQADSEIAMEQRIDVQNDEESAADQAKIVANIKDECDAKISEALPILNVALATLNTLTPADISVVKTMKNPPIGVKVVLEAVCIFKDIKPDRIPAPAGGVGLIDDYWGPSKRMLGDIKFLDSLLSFDKDNIQPHIMKKLQERVLNNENFDPDKVKSASIACEGLCKWVIALTKYDVIVKFIAPKKILLLEADNQYQLAMNVLKVKLDQLAVVEANLRDIQTILEEQQKQYQNLKLEHEWCTQRLQRAQELILGLGGDRNRWLEAATNLEEKYETLTGDILISSGVIAYLGGFTPSFRQEQIINWVEKCMTYDVVCSEKFSLQNILGKAVEIRSWKIDGLPSDTFSIENGIIIENCRRWPLMIDPQGQANKWIKNKEKGNKLCIIRPTQADSTRILENALQFGLPVLLENIDENLDPMLESILLKQTFKQSGTFCIKLGDAIVEYNNNFRFFITTKLSNPFYLPEIAVKVTLINFMISAQGLQDQILAITVAKERPDLEADRNILIIQGAENNKLLFETEKKILEVLFTAENILEDETAIKTLTSAKNLVNEINEKQITTITTEKQINVARKAYNPIAIHATILFFTLGELSNIDPMYQYSLVWFFGLYINSIDNTEKAEDVVARLEDLQSHFTYSLYKNICRSLFEKDKLLFSLILHINLLKSKNKVNIKEWIFLLTGGFGFKNIVPNPAKWLPERIWNEVGRLSTLPAFINFDNHVQENLNEWKKYFELTNPTEAIYPDPWEKKLNSFQKLLIMRVFRPDKLLPYVQLFVANGLGKKFVEPPSFNLKASFKDSSCSIPLIFILTPGSDPSNTLLKFADDQGFGTSKLFSLSLGQGQEPLAIKLIEEGSKLGNWIILQNCHLAQSFMPMLEKICESLKPDTTHPDFRLWLTSYPVTHFPITVLQNGIKMTNDAPKGLRLNIMRSLLNNPINNSDWYESCKQPIAFKRLLYSLCFFHGIVQERRNYGPIGWNIPYEFNDTDLQISLIQLKMFLDEYSGINYDALRYLTGECNYGGRVTDDWDRRTLKTLLNKFYTSKITNENEIFYYNESNLYFTPNENDYGEYMSYTDNLPNITSPNVFGFNQNAEIVKEQQETELFLKTVVVTQELEKSQKIFIEKISKEFPENLLLPYHKTSLIFLKDINSSEQSSESQSQGNFAISIATVILEKLPSNFDIDEVTLKYPTDYYQSMNTVLIQEMYRFNNLLTEIRVTLTNLRSAIRGEIIISPRLEEMLKSILIDKVPQIWLSRSYPSLKNLGSYVEDFLRRLKFFQDWYIDGTPCTYWLPGFYFIQGFLTAIQQNYSRKNSFPIDVLTFDYDVLTNKKINNSPEEGVFIYGLYLEGARWDEKLICLEECRPRELYFEMPYIWIKPIQKISLIDRKAYVCPLYKTAARRGVLSTTGHSTNFVVAILLNCSPNTDPAYWILRGTALLCQLNF